MTMSSPAHIGRYPWSGHPRVDLFLRHLPGPDVTLLLSGARPSDLQQHLFDRLAGHIRQGLVLCLLLSSVGM